MSMDELFEERKRLEEEWARLNEERATFEQERKDSGMEYKLFVGNLDDTSVEDDMRVLFSPFGAIKEIVMLKTRDGKSKRSCFIKYFYKKSANAAIAALNSKVKDKNSNKELAIRYAEGKSNAFGMPATHSFDSNRKDYGSTQSEYKLFVGNLDETSNKEDMQSLFGTYGAIKEVIMLKSNEGKSKRSCFIKYNTREAALSAIAGLNGKIRDKNSSKEIAIRFAQARSLPPVPMMPGISGISGMSGISSYASAASAMNSYVPYNSSQFSPYSPYHQPQQQPTMMMPPGPSYGPIPSREIGSGSTARGPTGSNLYVNNIPYGETEEKLRSLFSDFGQVLSTKLFSGYGFVSFDNPQSAHEAIQCLNGLMIGNGTGKPLEVRLKKDRTEGSSGNGKAQPRYTPY